MCSAVGVCFEEIFILLRGNAFASILLLNFGSKGFFLLSTECDAKTKWSFALPPSLSTFFISFA